MFKMNLTHFRANGDFSQSMLEHFRESQWNWDGDAVRGAFARANATSSAAAENARDLWRHRRRWGKIELSEKNDRFII